MTGPAGSEGYLAQTIRRLGQTGFETALADWFQRLVGPDSLVVLTYADSGRPEILYRQSRTPAVFARLDSTYVAGAYLLDPNYDLHLRRVPAGAYRLSEVSPDAFQRSRYYLEYLRETGIVDEVTFVAYPAPGLSLNLCLSRDGGSETRFAARDVAICRQIAPVVVALAERHWAALRPRSGADDVTAALIDGVSRTRGVRLTPRQAEVALLILRGHSTPSIGLRLGVSPGTVKVFRRQLYGRLGLTSQAELFALLVPLLSPA
jgi:DNA-binding CsgD family transcriptional regulator